MSKTISFRFKKGNKEHAAFTNTLLESEREKHGYNLYTPTMLTTIEAALELSDIIINIRASDLTDAEKEQLTAYYLVGTPAESETTK